MYANFTNNTKQNLQLWWNNDLAKIKIKENEL